LKTKLEEEQINIGVEKIKKFTSKIFLRDEDLFSKVPENMAEKILSYKPAKLVPLGETQR
jgi:hypothetical protein